MTKLTSLTGLSLWYRKLLLFVIYGSQGRLGQQMCRPAIHSRLYERCCSKTQSRTTHHAQYRGRRSRMGGTRASIHTHYPEWQRHSFNAYGEYCHFGCRRATYATHAKCSGHWYFQRQFVPLLTMGFFSWSCREASCGDWEWKYRVSGAITVLPPLSLMPPDLVLKSCQRSRR